MKKTFFVIFAILLLLLTIKAAIAFENVTKVSTRTEMLAIITGCNGELVQEGGGMKCIDNHGLEKPLTTLDRIIIPAIIIFLIWIIISIISPKEGGKRL